MKAAIVERYGPPEVVQVIDHPDPRPKPGDVIVRVAASAVSSGDARIRGASFPRGFGPLARPALGLRGPRVKVLGVAFSGVVETVGSDVREVFVGDEVCGMTGVSMGAHAELVRVKATKVVPKPATVSHDDAAGVLFGGTTAWQFFTAKTTVRAGQSVLVNGASGAVGTNAVQLAKHVGATVSAVCSAANRDVVARLGADHVIDYEATPLTAVADRFDVVLDAVGNLSPRTGRRLLTDGGVLLLAVATLGQTVVPRRGVKAGAIAERPEDFQRLLALVETGDLVVEKEVILPLSDIVEAYRRVDSGRKVGNVIVRP